MLHHKNDMPQKILIFFLTLIFTSIAQARIPKSESFPPKVLTGHGISYGPYRDGESPDDNSLTSKENIAEDLEIISRHWNMIRIYGSGAQASRILDVIRKKNYPIKVMLGAWIDGHWSKEKNDQQVNQAIELANIYKHEVCAVNIGNEIFVDWAHHRMKGDEKTSQVVNYIRKTKSMISQPVTVCDDYNFWNKPHSKIIADEIDFIGLHAYAFWNNINLNKAVSWTHQTYDAIQKAHPHHQIVMCESGWPTNRIYNDGSYEGSLVGKAGEHEQSIFLQQYNHWIIENDITSFYFQVFDEKWKGGFDGKNPMEKCEKHWGLFTSNRQPKNAIKNKHYKIP
jgi:exo-beta-1,3-glucanase (GH17 family)